MPLMGGDFGNALLAIIVPHFRKLFLLDAMIHPDRVDLAQAADQSNEPIALGGTRPA